MKKRWIVMMAFGLVAGITAVQAADTKDHEKAEAAEAAKNTPALATAMKQAKISLVDGLKASQAQGKPISGKFEVEDGKLQLSVYTVKDSKFFEVIIDHQTGKVAKTEPIAEEEDVENATRQSDAMAKATASLADVVVKAEKANAGYHAVSVAAEIEGGAANADVTLLKGTAWKKVDEKL